MNIQRKEQFLSEFEHLPEELQNKAIDFVHSLKLKQADLSWNILSMQNFFEDESEDDKLYDNYTENLKKLKEQS